MEGEDGDVKFFGEYYLAAPQERNHTGGAGGFCGSDEGFCVEVGDEAESAGHSDAAKACLVF